MHILISYPAGIMVEGLLVRQTAGSMRILAPGLKDPLELHHDGESWATERGERVEVELIGRPFPSQERLGHTNGVAHAMGSGGV